MRRSLRVVVALFAPLAMAQTQRNFDAPDPATAHPSLCLDFNDTTTSFRDQVSGLKPFIAVGDQVRFLPHQPGFDATAPDNTSASFIFNSYATAPNGNLGSFEWNQAFSIHYTVDGLTATPAAPLFVQGDYSSPYSGIGYGLDWGLTGLVGEGSGRFVSGSARRGRFGKYSVCGLHPVRRRFPMGYNLDIWATYAGTGDPSDLHLLCQRCRAVPAELEQH